MNYEIRAIAFLDDGLSVEFIDFDQDVKTNGLLLNHALMIPDTTDYHDGIEELRAKAIEVLTDAMEDWATTKTFVPGSTPDQDEGPSPYDNPLERDLGSTP